MEGSGKQRWNHLKQHKRIKLPFSFDLLRFNCPVARPSVISANTVHLQRENNGFVCVGDFEFQQIKTDQSTLKLN